MDKIEDAKQPAAPVHEMTTSVREKCFRVLVLLGVACVAYLVARSGHVRSGGSRASDAVAPPPTAESGKSVSLAIDFGDGNQQDFDALPWHEGMTVDDLLTVASRLPNGISYTVVGVHDTMFLTRINKMANHRTEGLPFWTYRVNGKWADRSLGVYQLAPGDHVSWIFGPERQE
jgi:hypothetical protein